MHPPPAGHTPCTRRGGAAGWPRTLGGHLGVLAKERSASPALSAPAQDGGPQAGRRVAEMSPHGER